MNLHLFFDVFIEDGPLGVYLRGDKGRFKKEHAIRSATDAYKFQSKFDITRYTLASYATIPWSGVTIRIECDNPKHQSIYDELGKLFPTGDIQKTRSDTAKKYLDALLSFDLKNNPWLFFSPNNDHPFIGSIQELEAVIDDANKTKERYPNALVSICYSHFTECQNFFKPTQHEWGAYGDVFPKLLYETDHSYVLELNRLLIDSIHIFQYEDLKRIFSLTKNSGRVIKLEDTEFYLSNNYKHILVIPKTELCRHYDGYMHLLDKVPPLFIPDGFFESKIKASYGYPVRKDGYIHINPLSIAYSYLDPMGADLRCLQEDLPSFWQSRFLEFDVNPDFPTVLPRNQITANLDIQNPYRDTSKISNFIRSFNKLFKYNRKKWIKRI